MPTALLIVLPTFLLLFLFLPLPAPLILSGKGTSDAKVDKIIKYQADMSGIPALLLDLSDRLLKLVSSTVKTGSNTLYSH